MFPVPARERGGRTRPLRALTTAPPPPSAPPRIALAAVASFVGTIVVPSAVITLYAVAVRSATPIGAFALRVAEPTALAAAVVVTGWGARWAARGAPRPRAIGVATGVSATALGVAAAAWVGDVDGWTAAAVVLQPLAGLLGGMRARREAASPIASHAGRVRSAEGSDGAQGLVPPPSSHAPRVTTPAVAFEATLVPPATAARPCKRPAPRDEPARD